MLDCLARFVCNAALEFLRQWLRDWGTLLLTAVIASATVMEGIFAMRLYRLQRAIEKIRLEPLLFCRVKGHELGGTYTRLDAQLANLSSYGVWIDEMIVVLNGPVSCDPTINRKIEIVLAASQTEGWTLFSVPFREIVPFGASAPTSPVTFKLQVKFSYSTTSLIGIQTSPVYDVTILGGVVTSLKLESETKSL